MNIILVLIPITLFILAIAVWAFFWAVRSGQFDDLETPAYDILMEDDGHHREKALETVGGDGLDGPSPIQRRNHDR